MSHRHVCFAYWRTKCTVVIESHFRAIFSGRRDALENSPSRTIDSRGSRRTTIRKGPGEFGDAIFREKRQPIPKLHDNRFSFLAIDSGLKFRRKKKLTRILEKWSRLRAPTTQLTVFSCRNYLLGNVFFFSFSFYPADAVTYATNSVLCSRSFTNRSRFYTLFAV